MLAKNVQPIKMPQDGVDGKCQDTWPMLFPPVFAPYFDDPPHLLLCSFTVSLLSSKQSLIIVPSMDKATTLNRHLHRVPLRYGE